MTGNLLINVALTFGTGVLHLIQKNHQPDATVFQFIILTLFAAQRAHLKLKATAGHLNN
jgi:hypothetical protein